jgi:hypothetical protein
MHGGVVESSQKLSTYQQMNDVVDSLPGESSIGHQNKTYRNSIRRIRRA